MSDIQAYTPDDAEEVKITAYSQLRRAQMVVVDSARSYEAAADGLQAIKGAQKLLSEKKKLLTEPMNVALKAVRDMFRAPEDELANAETIVKGKMLGFQVSEENARKAAQAKIDAQTERDRLAALERSRKAQESADAARAAGDLAKAQKFDDKAESWVSAAEVMVSPIIQREAPKVVGISTRDNWRAEVRSVKDLIAAVASGAVPTMALEPNMKFLNGQAKAMKQELRYPGVVAVVDKVMASGST